ncbi:kinase-like domain-containing protein [Lipomyces tetrasporus]|uniref:Carbon catabolite-derepressing protein kinase n=1 Tax=Lipomyces tetrasporus TaxID=54092 RepID=A0AAD7VPF5_9ASCO|nr:kinase-like domain-containing protein [Lipomyces tetrasporus]KAJ8097747.1 kinase-like domain-containing protein [Lipomyces tetrasporus]
MSSMAASERDSEEPRESRDRVSSGQRIGRYQIIKTLGEGSFGKVKLAYHLATHQRVALKIINRKTLAKSDMQGRVEREISYLRLLRHPHIIKLYDVIKSKDEIIMVIEFAGKELFDYIVQRGKMPEDEARRFFQQIICAVEYCHRHKIVHRDLKPENLLLDENLNVKIADFGLSNIMTDGNFLKTSCGSPNYAAPEVISGKLYAGPEVDVWSCGVILYVMLCGRLPFDDEFIPTLFKKINGGVYTLPSYLSPGAKHLLQRMLIVNPLNRITVREIMQDKWFKVNLPDYLLRPEDKSSAEIDETVVGALGRTMGYDKEEVYDALKSKGESNEIRDAYELMRENKLMEKDSDNKDGFLSSSPSWKDGIRSNQGSQYRKGNEQTLTFDSHHLSSALNAADLSTPNTTIAVLPSSLPTYHRANMLASNPGLAANLEKVAHATSSSNRKSKTRWHFGIRSRSYPLDVMGEIYRALKGLGAEWAKPTEEDPWTILVRWKYIPRDYSDGEPLQGEQGKLMKMQIQLYQLEQNNYLVDFKFDGWWNEGDEHEMAREKVRRRRSGSSTNVSRSSSVVTINSGNVNNMNVLTNLTTLEKVKPENGNSESDSQKGQQNGDKDKVKAGPLGGPNNTKQKEEDETLSTYPFLHMATRLIMELAVNSQAA